MPIPTLYSPKIIKTLKHLMRRGTMQILMRERAGEKLLKRNLMI
jgi:hypothetical protein